MELMGLVDKDEINIWSLATCDRLDATNLDRLVAIGALVDALHDANAVDALGFECRDGLVDQAERGNREGDPLSLVQRTLDDVRGRQRLAETGGSLKHRPSLSGRHGSPEPVQRALLAQTEGTQRAFCGGEERHGRAPLSGDNSL